MPFSPNLLSAVKENKCYSTLASARWQHLVIVISDVHKQIQVKHHYINVITTDDDIFIYIFMNFQELSEISRTNKTLCCCRFPKLMQY